MLSALIQVKRSCTACL